MKKNNKLLILFLVSFSIFIFTGCKTFKEQTGRGYGIVYEEFVGVATIKVKNERITSLNFDEIYMPTVWATLFNVEHLDEELYFKVENLSEELFLAKYIMIGNVKLTGKITNTNKVIYSSKDISNLKVYLARNETNAKWYAEAVLNNNIKITDSDFNTIDVEYYGKKIGYTKATTSYWPESSGNGLGWKKNMEALIDTFVGTKLDFDNRKIVQDETTNEWIFDGVLSSATLTSAKDYYALTKRAYNNAIK